MTTQQQHSKYFAYQFIRGSGTSYGAAEMDLLDEMTTRARDGWRVIQLLQVQAESDRGPFSIDALIEKEML